MPRTFGDEAIQQRLQEFTTNLTTIDREAVPSFYADDVDYRGSGDVMAARQANQALQADLSRRAAARTFAVRPINDDFTLVDLVFDEGGKRGWFTEVWSKAGDAGQSKIVSTRTRFGTPAKAFEALTGQTQRAVASRVDEATADAELTELQGRFKEFRTAFNSGDSSNVMSLFAEETDALVAFSFIDGRAQMLDNAASMEAKAQRMMGETTVALEAAGRERLGAVFVGGQPKTVRFLSKDVAVVDGTAEIAGIPQAHGFSPSSMSGVYTNVWSKRDGTWKCVGARPWF